MAEYGKIVMKKLSGGVLNVTATDGATSTDLVLPLSGTVASTDGATIDNTVPRYDGVSGKLQGSSVVISDSGNIGNGTQSFNGFGGSGFKNKIINGNFDVWQRGTDFSAVGYCADRWHLAIGGSANAMKHNVTPNTVLLTTTAASSFANLYQALETATVIGLRGKTLTLSLKLQVGGTHTGGFALAARYSNSTDTLNMQSTTIQSLGISASSTNTRYSLTFTVPNDAVGLRIDIENTAVQASGALYQVQEVQLEEGLIATPFENRPFGLELSFCQRYCFNPKYGADVANQVVRGDAYGVDSVNGRINFKFPVSMRTTPSLYLSQGVSSLWLGYPEAIQITSLAQSIASCNESAFTYSVASGNTAFKHYHLYMPNASHQILFLSEL